MSAAQASTLDALDIIQSYNAISLGDFNMRTSHVEGTMFVGGNLHNSNDTDVNGDNQQTTFGGAALVVGGDVTGGQMRVLNGDAEIGGSANGKVAMNGGGTLTEGASVPVADYAEKLSTLSTFLSTFQTTTGAYYNSADQNAPLNLGAGDADGYVFLNLTESEANSLFSNNINSLTTSAYSGVILNIAGSSFNRTGNWNAQASNVILNFYEATSFGNTNGNLNFSVLAPFADVTTAGSGMNGFVVGKTITNFAEIRPPYTDNPLNYSGTLPDQPEVRVVPLPAGAVLMLSALAAFGVARRRKAA